ncbi:MAG: Maf family protein [Bdellovibrionota bacterium]
MELVLASGSPRRRQMLESLGIAFSVKSSNINEARLRGEPAHHFVQRLAREKAESVVSQKRSSSSDWIVLAADTVVVYGTLVLGKPSNQGEALKMLTKLSGRTHEVVTGYCWMGTRESKLRVLCGHVRTRVTFADMPTDFWKWYVSTGEPMDKAGAYAAQGIGLSFIEKVSGSYSNVIGLPLPQVLKAFTKTFGGNLYECCKKSS